MSLKWSPSTTLRTITAPVMSPARLPVARDAAVVLASADLSRLRACQDPQCRWVFRDGTRSRTRRWCAMAGCGNRAKLRTRRVSADAIDSAFEILLLERFGDDLSHPRAHGLD